MGATPVMATAIVGAAYGDEGKGLLTDAIAARFGAAATVVRFNGGAQAGHTVTTPDGRRHVFHHAGSGSFAGARTFLSRFFVANPILLRTELEALARLGVVPEIAIDPRALVTTPFDMLINQIVERARGGARHGSCGLGFGETIERSLRAQFALTAGALADDTAVRTLLARIRTGWVPVRLARLGVAALTQEDTAFIAAPGIVERWLEDVAAFRAAVTITAKPSARHWVFEGAQGLLLDQDRGVFPYVTRSNTGVRNIVPLARELGVDQLDLIYATRTYTTRHGAGPLPHELESAPYPGITDATNIANPWQGTLRFANLDLDRLARAIRDDQSDLGTSRAFSTTLHLAMTCLDQAGPAVDYVVGDRQCVTAPDTLAAVAAARIGASHLISSYGPTRATLQRTIIG